MKKSKGKWLALVTSVALLGSLTSNTMLVSAQEAVAEESAVVENVDEVLLREEAAEYSTEDYFAEVSAEPLSEEELADLSGTDELVGDIDLNAAYFNSVQISERVEYEASLSTPSKVLLYKFTTPGYSANISFNITNVSLDESRVIFEIYSADSGEKVAETYVENAGKFKKMTAKLKMNEDYYIKAYSSEGARTGNFKFSYMADVDEPDDADTAQAVEESSNYLTGSIGLVGDEDWFKFTTGNTCVYYTFTLADVSSDTNITKLSIVNAKGGEAAYTRAEQGKTSAINVKLDPNTEFFIKITSATQTTGDYKFKFKSTVDEPDNITTAQEAKENTVYNGNICVGADEDWFKIVTNDSPATYIFTLTNISQGNTPASISIINKNGAVLTTDVAVGDNTVKDIVIKLDPGTVYYAKIFNSNKIIGDYAFKYVSEKDASDTKKDAEDALAKAWNEQTIGAVGDQDWFKIAVGRRDMPCTFTLRNDSVNNALMMQLLDVNGQDIMINSTTKAAVLLQETNKSVSMNVTLKAGNVYYLKITSREQGTGKYAFYYEAIGMNPDVEHIYSDLNGKAWYIDYVQTVYDKGIMSGYSGTTNFGPEDSLTRAQFATMLYRLAGKPQVTFVRRFADVESGMYYSDAIEWCAQKGIVTGYNDGSGRFGVNDKITREQLAAMLYRYAAWVDLKDVTGRVSNLNTNYFPDVESISGYAQAPMSWCIYHGIVGGEKRGDANYLNPQGNATRAACAAMITRYLALK